MPLPHFLRLLKTADDITPGIRLWILRLLIPLNAHPEFSTQHGFTNDAVAKALGLGARVDLENRDFDVKKVRAALRKLFQACEGEPRDTHRVVRHRPGGVAA